MLSIGTFVAFRGLLLLEKWYRPFFLSIQVKIPRPVL